MLIQQRLKWNNAFLLPRLLPVIAGLLLSSCSQSPTDELTGYIEGDYMYIASPFQGRLTQLKVQRGQSVKAGNALFVLEPEPEAADSQQAQQQLAQAEAGEKLAAQRLERFRRLYATRTVAKDALDAAVSNYNQQRANAAAARAVVTKTSWSIQQKTIAAPASGIIDDTYFQPGELVPTGNPVLAILPENKVNILFFVPETKLHQIKIGAQVSVQTDSGSRYQAAITYIAPQMEYTPPVIYSRSNNYKLVYRVKAAPAQAANAALHPGQPVYITLPRA